LNRHGLQKRIGHVPALAIIKVQQVVGGAVQHPGERRGEGNGVVYAKIHSHATERIVDMRRIAGEQGAAAAIGVCDSLVHGIEVGVDDRIGAAGRDEALQAALRSGEIQQFLNRRFRRGWKHHPPETRRPFAWNLEQSAPFARV
jgi:hypothetical protein